ncbi:MAG: competence/damage-inducible protein A [Cyanobacteria bacterium P01_H01_bin.121]
MERSAEVICVGTELLLGDILNSNSQFLAQQLATLGIPHYYQTVVGDNPTRLQRAVAIACDRAKLLIFTGGLGPTPDDLTIETLANFFEFPLVERPEIIADIERKAAARGRTLTANNYKQAYLPKGADILPNPSGTAPGVIWQPRPGLLILTFPGVPREMQQMWQATAVPYLQANGWSESTLLSRTLRFWGIAESALAEKVQPFFEGQNPTVAPYASMGQARLRITAKAPTEAAAAQLIAPVEQQLRQLVGIDCFGADADSLASAVGALLSQRQETLAVAESCTGGGLGQMLTAIPGSSSYFQGGVISYANSVKTNILKVPEAVLAQEGAVSHTTAKQMALGVKAYLQTDWALSITGIAGPGGGNETKPVGLVYIGLAGANDLLTSYEYRFGAQSSRDWIRHLSACNALDRLRRQLLAE